ncbi:inhibitor of nuclear factor kappa-B kinase-interacting protein-like isoform X1 [Salvelinus namaycush]|uniref:Inhibitor of nuclear factor kappa-B kinase-interacting protein-like isoform X1 n=1 Tax=Salvelinus namaycush TaxID=8040 RepID=A0A8U0Q0H9_SALNM|nr:inhibitor of nuclear factor kappa-B kinase-interacting protein-like isoform X1 [Salvelinus namaycush]
MPSNEVKQRKKTTAQKQNDEPVETSKYTSEDEAKKAKATEGNCLAKPTSSSPSSLDVKTITCLLSLIVCIVLTWVVLQQNARFFDVEEKYKLLSGKTASLLEMEEDVIKVSKKYEGLQSLLEHLERQPGGLLPHLEALERDVSQLKDWASGLTEKRGLLQDSVAALTVAVGQIEGRTSAITKDVNTKVASVRTDVRRMDGLQSEVESLLEKVRELEERAAQAEHSMVKRIGDLLAGSIDRIQGLKGATERNAQALEQLKRRLPELFANDRQISERLRELESGCARLVRTVTFAGDLKPKVAAIKRDFRALAPQVDELTLRIGRLAEDLTRREEDIAELRQTFANLSAVEDDLGVVTQQLSQIVEPEMPVLGGEMLLQKVNGSEALPQTLEGEL